MPDKPQLVEILFPLAGVNVTSEFNVQPPGTTPVGKNVRVDDPILQRDRGGTRYGLAKYPVEQIPEGSKLIQHLFQLVEYNADLLLTTAEDYQPDFILDPSTGSRNPGRSVNPFGSGVQPNRNRPRTVRRRVQIVPSSETALLGQTVTLVPTLTLLPASSPVAGVPVQLLTQPPGMDGDGDIQITDGSGEVSFDVSEDEHTGDIRYLAYHRYNLPGVPFPLFCRGSTIVNWSQNWNLTLTSKDGTKLDADGKPHVLQAKLTDQITGKAIRDKFIRLQTGPSDRVGDRQRVRTDARGRAIFRVSDDQEEIVIYTADVPPHVSPEADHLPQPSRVQSNDVAIQWGDVPDDITFVSNDQGTYTSTGLNATVDVLPIDEETFLDVVAGDLIVLFHFYDFGPGGVSTIDAGDIADTLGSAYEFIISVDMTVSYGPKAFARMFYGIAADTGLLKISVPITTGPGGGGIEMNTRHIMALVYRGVDPVNPLIDSAGQNQPTAVGLNFLSPGKMTAEEGSMAVVDVHIDQFSIVSVKTDPDPPAGVMVNNPTPFGGTFVYAIGTEPGVTQQEAGVLFVENAPFFITSLGATFRRLGGP